MRKCESPLLFSSLTYLHFQSSLVARLDPLRRSKCDDKFVMNKILKYCHRPNHTNRLESQMMLLSLIVGSLGQNSRQFNISILRVVIKNRSTYF